MTKPKVLITDDVHPILIQSLEKHYQVDFKPAMTYAEVQALVHDYTGLIINSKIICNPTFIDHASQLKFIGRLGSGREVVDIPYAESRGIKVYFSPEGNKNAVAEHALGMLLALARQLVPADGDVRQQKWAREARRGWELSEKTIGIIGFGETGSQFTKKLQSLDMVILVHDKYKTNFLEEYPYVKEASKEQIMSEADIISFHLPWAADTVHYANAGFFEHCKQGTIILNTSRGHVIDTKALIESLELGHIGGACLDVFENEKTNTFSEAEQTMYTRLYQMNQVVLSPHIAGWTHESKYKMAQVLVSKILGEDQ